FNACFRQAYGMAPRELRRRPEAGDGEVVTLRLNYRPPYDFAATLDFLRQRALPGVERVDDEAYARAFADAGGTGWFRVSRWPRAEARTARLPTVADAGDGGAGAAHVRPRRRSPGDRRRALARRGIAAAAAPAPGPAPARRLGRVRDRGTRGARPAGERGRRAYPRRAPGPPPRDAVAAGAGGLRPAMPVPGAGADRHSGPVGPRRARGARTHDPRDRTRPARRP